MFAIKETIGTKYTLVKKETKYACNGDNIGDLVWMQSKFQRPFTKETKHDCNLKSKTDFKCVQSVALGTRYACNVESRPRITRQ